MRTTKCKILKKEKKLMQSIFNHYLPFLFSTFTIMLNMINLREIEGPKPVSLYFLHVLYVFMVSILLLNFLIAVFSDSVNNVNRITMSSMIFRHCLSFTLWRIDYSGSSEIGIHTAVRGYLYSITFENTISHTGHHGERYVYHN